MVKLFVCLMPIFVALSTCDMQRSRAWGITIRRPRLFGDKIPLNALNPTYTRVTRKIVLYHNFFRSRVKPTASNMLRMSWHTDAARLAQSWANKCQPLQHDSSKDRRVPHLGACGQNIFISSHQVPWFFAIKNWFLENEIFKYGWKNNSLTGTGHYTQLVWATSRRVGCGIARCINSKEDKDNNKPTKPRVFYNYVCNYCPTGNWKNQFGTPYIAGKKCSMCPKCCQEGLCGNPCLVQDRWINCDYRLKMEGPRLCTPGTWAARNCLATCLCKRTIREWHNMPPK